MKNSPSVELVTLAPGHFHAALVQKHPLERVSPHVHIYAPLDQDLASHLERLAGFNTRPDSPSHCSVNLSACEDWLERFQNERPGNTVVISGRNRPKIDLILAAIRAGYCVLADKPWIVDAADFPKLQAAILEAEQRGVFAWDIMTERWEVTSILQKRLMNDPEIFGDPLVGTPEEPAFHAESVHYLCKRVAGVPLRRPVWWYDPATAGEGIADVGTHLADLAMWMMFPDQAIDFEKEITILNASRWPTHVDRGSFRENTNCHDFSNELAHLVEAEKLLYWGNGEVNYRLKDRHVRLITNWGVRDLGTEGDTNLIVARGSRSKVIVCHDAELGSGPQVLVEPNREGDLANIFQRVEEVCKQNPEYRVLKQVDAIHVQIPAKSRTGHESHFAAVLGQFVDVFQNRSKMPQWESPNLLAKYFVTTEAVRRARENLART